MYAFQKNKKKCSDGAVSHCITATDISELTKIVQCSAYIWYGFEIFGRHFRHAPLIHRARDPVI